MSTYLKLLKLLKTSVLKKTVFKKGHEDHKPVFFAADLMPSIVDKTHFSCKLHLYESIALNI